MTLQAGDKAPEFNLPNETGESVSLTDLQGKKVVLYFYPADDTSGCTAEACGIRDVFPRFEAKDAVVLGVSPDSSESHMRFREKYSLPFSLLADTKRRAAQDYGVLVMRERDGKENQGIQRSTFIINEQGRVERIFESVSPAEHAQELLEALSS